MMTAKIAPPGELSLVAGREHTHGTIHNLISKSPFFSNLEDDEIEMLAVWVKAYSAPTGTVILKEGDGNACLCVVAEGKINIIKKIFPGEMQDEEEVKIAEINAGDSIGEMGVIDGQPLSATAISSENSVVLIITREDFQNLLVKNSNLGVKILSKVAQVLSIRLRLTTGRLADLLASKKKT